MGIILDTSVLIEAEKGRFDTDSLVKGREEELFGLSVITVSELLHGVHRADTEKKRLIRSAFVEKVLELFPIYTFDISGARIYAEIWANLLKKGIQVGAHDLIIASTAIAYGFSVATFNHRDFKKIEGLRLELLSDSEGP